MIKVRLRDSDGTITAGGVELIARWEADQTATLWVDLQGSADKEQIAILKGFGCHDLAITDALRDRHPPKIESFSEHLYILFRGISSAEDFLDIQHLQISVFVGERYVVTRHQKPSLSISHWIDAPELAAVMMEPMELAIKILHYSCGKYLSLLLDFEERLSEIEDVLATGPSDEALKELTLYKTRLMKLKRIFDYHQNMLERFPVAEFKDNSDMVHLHQDLFERCERLFSLSAMYYEICGDLVEGNLSLFSHQMNLAMRVLTVITAIFVPLSFIAGLYGMNFEYMPELQHHTAYFYVLGFMLALSVGLVSLFKWKKWL